MFVMPLSLCAAITAAAGAAVLATAGWARLPGQVVLGLMFAHAVELQHQSLHGTGLATARGNRWVGRLLGLPMLVSYSHYRARHLRHHRYLGTSRDTEFFQYDAVEALTPAALLASAFNVRRYGTFARNLVAVLCRRLRTGRRRGRGTASSTSPGLVVDASSPHPSPPDKPGLGAVAGPLRAEPFPSRRAARSHRLHTTSRDPSATPAPSWEAASPYCLTNCNNFHVDTTTSGTCPCRLPAVHTEAPRHASVGAEYLLLTPCADHRSRPARVPRKRSQQ